MLLSSSHLPASSSHLKSQLLTFASSYSPLTIFGSGVGDSAQMPAHEPQALSRQASEHATRQLLPIPQPRVSCSTFAVPTQPSPDPTMQVPAPGRSPAPWQHQLPPRFDGLRSELSETAAAGGQRNSVHRRLRCQPECDCGNRTMRHDVSPNLAMPSTNLTTDGPRDPKRLSTGST